jgi:predicted metal-binding membrane protein
MTMAPIVVAPHVPRLPLRDRVVIFSALGGVSLLAWIYLIDMAIEMKSPNAITTCAMCVRNWTIKESLLMFWMWAIMMIGMMVPTAMPMTLIYAAVARKAQQQGSRIAPTFLFVSGYILIWTLFSAAATFAQWKLDQWALLSPTMVTTSPALGASILVLAGIYQLTPYKQSCLRHCRMPAYFIAEHWRDGNVGALRMGIVHGAFCLGCCWALMLLLFLGGIMSLFWILAITIFVLLEKIIPHGVGGAKLAGAVMIIFGIVSGVMNYAG